MAPDPLNHDSGMVNHASSVVNHASSVVNHASSVVNLVLATRNAWSRVQRLLGNARVSQQSFAPAGQAGRWRVHNENCWPTIKPA